MSRRSRSRGDKHERFNAEPSPGLVAALDEIKEQKRQRESDETIVTHSGERFRLSDPWPMPKEQS